LISSRECDRSAPPVHLSTARLDAEAFEHRRVPPPLRPSLDLELEEDRVAEDELDLRPGAGADLLDDRAPPADHDLFLRFGLDEQRRADDLLRQLVDLDRDRMRHLVARQLERLFTDQLRELELERQIRSLVRREVLGSLNEELHEIL